MQFNKSRRIGGPLRPNKLGFKQRKITLLDMYETPEGTYKDSNACV